MGGQDKGKSVEIRAFGYPRHQPSKNFARKSCSIWDLLRLELGCELRTCLDEME